MRHRLAGGSIVNRWKPQQVLLVLRLAIVLAVALVGAGLEGVDGWTWIESEAGDGWTWTDE